MVREAGGQTRSSSSEQPALIIIPSMRPSRRREVEVTRLDLDGPVCLDLLPAKLPSNTNTRLCRQQLQERYLTISAYSLIVTSGRLSQNFKLNDKDT